MVDLQIVANFPVNDLYSDSHFHCAARRLICGVGVLGFVARSVGSKPLALSGQLGRSGTALEPSPVLGELEVSVVDAMQCDRTHTQTASFSLYTRNAWPLAARTRRRGQ